MNSSIITFDIVKDRVLSLLKEDTNDEKEFLTCSENFNDAPKSRQWKVSPSLSISEYWNFWNPYKSKVNPVLF